ncbi:hypothetical protein VIGAN_06270900, partial [Vigna angularis var. angularis]
LIWFIGKIKINLDCDGNNSLSPLQFFFNANARVAPLLRQPPTLATLILFVNTQPLNLKYIEELKTIGLLFCYIK